MQGTQSSCRGLGCPQFLLSSLAACGGEERYVISLKKGDILKDPLQELQETFYREIPITKQLGITVESYDGEHLTLKAPIGANINHKHTAFAGSLNSLVTLAGWGLLWLMLKELDIAANIIIQDSTCNYLRPVTRDFSASCRKPDPADINKFEKTLRTRGKARLELLSEIHEAGKVAVSFKGRYVIHLS